MSNNDDALSFEGAVIWAAVAHDGQVRADGKEPYLAHCLRVALVVSARSRVAAVLHDVLEDTEDGLPGRLDEVSAEAVCVLTKDKDGETYEQYVDRVASHPGEAGEIAREVKIADLHDNLQSDPTGIPMKRRIKLVRRYRAALVVLASAKSETRQSCKFCGSVYGTGECCPDCLRLCTCPWEKGMGADLKCPIHGLIEYRRPLHRTTH